MQIYGLRKWITIIIFPKIFTYFLFSVLDLSTLDVALSHVNIQKNFCSQKINRRQFVVLKWTIRVILLKLRASG